MNRSVHILRRLAVLWLAVLIAAGQPLSALSRAAELAPAVSGAQAHSRATAVAAAETGIGIPGATPAAARADPRASANDVYRADLARDAWKLRPGQAAHADGFQLAQLTTLGATSKVTAAATSTTLDPANTPASLTLSNGNLTITKNTGSAWANARSLGCASSGKYVIQINNDNATGNIALGAGTTAIAQTGFVGNDANGIASYSTDTIVYVAGGNSFSLTSTWGSAGNKLKMALDLTNHKAWFANVGQLWYNASTATQDPENNVGGTTIPSGTICVYVSAESNGGAASVVFNVPSQADPAPVGFGSLP